MKKLFNCLRKEDRNENFAGNFLCFSRNSEGIDNSSPVEEESNIEQEINKKMKSPLGFGAKELRFLEKNEKSMNAFQKKRFRNIAAYQVTLARGKDMSDLPPRMLTSLAESPLLKLLSKKMQNQIVTEVNDQMKNLGSILNKNPDDWSTFELSKACVLYRRLRKNAVYEDGSRDGLFEDAKDKIIKKSFNLLSRPLGTDGKVNKVLAGEESQKELSLEERLLILEVRRMFPTERSWAEKARFHDWDKLAVRSISLALEKPEELMANPNSSFAWELLRDFLGENTNVEASGGLSKKIIDTFGEQKINDTFKRVEAIKFLQFAKNSRVFLPSHLQALQEIIDNKDLVKPIEDIKKWETYSEKNEDLEKLNKKLKDLQDKESKVKIYGLEEYLKSDKNTQKEKEKEWQVGGVMDVNGLESLKEEYSEIRKEEEKAINKAWDNQLSSWIIKGKAAWEEIKENKKYDLELQKDKALAGIRESSLSDEQKSKQEEVTTERFNKKIKDVSEEVSKEFDDFESGKGSITDFNKRKDYIQKFREFLDENGTEIQKTDEYKKLNKEYSEYNKSVSGWDQKISELSRKIPINDSIKTQKDKFSKDISKLKEEVSKKTKEMDGFKIFGEMLKNPKDIAEKAKENFISNLNERIKNRNLYAADFEVLWGDEIMEESQLLEDGTYQKNPYYEGHKKFREELGKIPNKEKIEEFRGKFEDVINGGILDGVTLSKLSDGDDKFAPWYNELDKKLSYENIISKLKEEGFDLKEEFKSPQQITQLIDGAIGSYRDAIFDSVMTNVDNLTSDEEKEFYAGWNRLHGGLDGMTDPTKIHQRHLTYEQTKIRSSEVVENAHQTNMAYVERLRKKAEKEQNTAKKAHYLEEARKLEESFDARRKSYKSGGNFWAKDENGNDKQYWAPGKDLLNEMDLQTQSISKEISTVTNKLRDDISFVAEEFRGISQIKDPVEKRLRESRARDKFDDLINSWPSVRDNLRGKISDLGSILNEIIPEGVTPDEFVNVYLKAPNKMIDSFHETFQDLNKYAKKIDYKFRGDEAFWNVFSSNFIKLDSALNLQNGDMALDSSNLDKYMEKANETLKFLTEIQFFDDDTAEKDEFTKNYDDIAAEFKSNFAEYQSTVNDVSSRLRRDANKLDDNEFFEKYGLDKEYMEDLLSQHKNTAEKFKNISSKFLNPDFLRDWIFRYDSSPIDRAEAINEMGDFQSLKEHAKNAKDYVKNMNSWIKEYDDNSGNNSQKTYQKFSLYDLYAIVKQAIEVNERRWKRRSDQAVAEIGMSFFGAESAWGKEFKQKAEESEEARVKEFETQYGEYPGWDIQKALYKTNDPDEAKACIRMLLDKGFMQWDDPAFWKTLMRLSNNAVRFRIPEDMDLSPNEILDKVKNACEFIWSRETFREWDTSLKSKLTSAMDGHVSDFERYENDPNARTHILSTMLKRWQNGDAENVDPARFECFIRKSFEFGKMNGQPDQRFYFLIMGASTINSKTGRALISRDSLMRMNGEFLVRYPHVDFFADKSSYKLNGRVVPKGTPGAEQRGWNFDDYMKWGEMMSDGSNSFDPRSGTAKEKAINFFYHVVHASGDARSRVQRMDRFADKEGDHDDAKSFFMEWNQTKVADHLSKSSDGGNKSSADFWRTYLAGFPIYMEQMKSYIAEGNSKYGEADYWKVEKERALMEVGDRLQSALTVTQTLQGNGNLGEKRGSMVLDRSQWNKAGGGFSYSAKDAKTNINDFMKKVFEKTDGGDDVKEVLDYMGVDHSISFEARDPILKEKGITKKLKKLIDSKESKQMYFENTEAIEKVLMNWKPPIDLDA